MNFPEERVLQRVTIFFSRGSSDWGIKQVSPTAGRFYTTQTPGKPVILYRVKSVLREGVSWNFLLPNLPEAGGMEGSVPEGVRSSTSSHLPPLLRFLPSFDMLAHSLLLKHSSLGFCVATLSLFIFLSYLKVFLLGKFHGDFPGPLFLFFHHECILSHAFKYYLMTFKFIIVTHMSWLPPELWI